MNISMLGGNKTHQENPQTERVALFKATQLPNLLYMEERYFLHGTRRRSSGGNSPTPRMQ